MQEVRAQFIPQFLTTAVGSLPHTEIREALDLIWQSVPLAPHWPQLPKTGVASSFISQYVRALVETGVIAGYEEPRFQVEAPDWTERLADFYALYLRAGEGEEQALASFGFGEEGGEGFAAFCRDIEEQGTREAVLLKGQLSGSLTVGLQITDKNRRASYYDETMRDMLVKSLAIHGQWQSKQLSRYGLPVLMMVDDPGLYSYGMSTHITLERSAIIADLNSIAEGIIRGGGIPGVHVCAGMDWTLLFDSKIQLVNFDAFEYMTSMAVLAGPLNEFLQRGGILSWGIVPTQAQAWQETAATLRQRLDDNIAGLVQRGVDEGRLRQQSMITPSCGTGTLSLELAAHIYGLLAELGQGRPKGLPVWAE